MIKILKVDTKQITSFVKKKKKKKEGEETEKN